MENDKKVNKIVRPELRELKPYVSPLFESERKMDLNESPFDLPLELKREIFSRLEPEQWQRYHDELEAPLKEALARYAGHVPEGVLIGNGSNELIFHALLATVSRGKAIVYPEPSFSLYRQNVAVLGGAPAPFRLNGKDFSVDAATVIDLARGEKAGAVVLCSPNNPTGNRIPNEVIHQVASNVGCVVILDEAYMQFAEDNAFSLLAECPNLLILRTFSKAFGLAGMRFGYCLCAPELAAEISKVQLPHHVNYFTQTAALVLLGHKDLVEQRVAEIKREREFIEREISVLTGVKVFPSEANFLLVEFSTKTPDDMFNALLETGILVRNISNYPGLSHCLRITVGPGEDNRALVKALAGVLS